MKKSLKIELRWLFDHIIIVSSLPTDFLSKIQPQRFDRTFLSTLSQFPFYILIIIIKHNHHFPQVQVIQMHQSHLFNCLPCNHQQKQNQSSNQLVQVNSSSIFSEGQISPQLFHKGKTRLQSQQEDSAVSFEQNILEQHIHCVVFEIQNLTNLLFQIVNFEFLLESRQAEPYGQRPPFENYLQQAFCLIKRQQVPFFTSLLSFSVNSYKFIQEIFETSSELLVHQLVFISWQIPKTFSSIQCWFYTISQLREISCDHRIIKMICDHQELKILSYDRVFGVDTLYGDMLRRRAQQFLQFYVHTCLLVKENYFINPNYEKILKKIKKSKKQKYRARFSGRERSRKKIAKKNSEQMVNPHRIKNHIKLYA